jgi:hypothetical protein
MNHIRHLLLVVAILGMPAVAHADDAVASYAVVVGSNAGGRGQETLRFAEDDARRVAEVLRDLGGYDADDIVTVLHPSPDELLAAIDEVGARVATDAAAGRQSKVFFYYSGHARASALNLGEHELELGALRERLTSLPATLTVVVLDACQSGAFSRVKGAEPVADFSFNSVAKLDAAGLAVLASSSATELSQESDSLGSSYFTHHFVVGLRGAGDTDGDSRVSLDEAYRWAYNQTLVSTAATAVGTQHVTLEVDLKGKGAVALTYFRASDAQLELPADLEAQVIVHTRKPLAVMAEVHKSSGAPVRLAFPRGDYQVLVRAAGELRRCEVTLRDGEITSFAPGACEVIPDDLATAKGAVALGPRWSIEISVGIGASPVDAYIERLQDFGYSNQAIVIGRLALTGVRRLGPRLDAIGGLAYLGDAEWHRDGEAGGITMGWKTTTLAGGVRGRLPLFGGWLVPYAQLDVGLAFTTSHLRNPASGEDVSSTDAGYQLGGAAGVQVGAWQRFGMSAQLSYVRAPALENLFGDVHDSGGVFLSLGARTSF